MDDQRESNNKLSEAEFTYGSNMIHGARDEFRISRKREKRE